MSPQRQIGAAPRYQPQRRVARPRAVELDYGDSLASIIIGGAAGIAAKALDEAADEERQRLEIAGQIEGIGAGHLAAMSGQPVPEGDIATWHGKAFFSGARTGYATALNNTITVKLDQAAAAAGEDLQAFDKAAAQIAAGFTQLPPDIKAAAEISLAEKGREYRGQIEAGLAKRQAEAQEFASRTALRLHAEKAQQAALAGNAAQAELARREHHASVAALIGRGMSADEAAATISRVDYELEEQRALGGFNRAAGAGPAQAFAYVGALSADAKAFSTPDTRARVMRTLEGQLNTMEAEQRRREAAAEKARRQTEEATFKRAIDLQASGQLNLDWLQRNRAGLSASDYGQLTRAATEPRPRRTDPVTYDDLRARAIEGEDVRREVRRAFLEGRLEEGKYDALNAIVEQGSERVIREEKDRISAFTGASGWLANDMARQRNAEALDELLRWRDEQRAAGRPITATEARVISDRALKAFAVIKPGDVVADPQFLKLDPKGAIDENATRAATEAARAAGLLTAGEHAEQERRITARAEEERGAREAAERLKQKGVR